MISNKEMTGYWYTCFTKAEHLEGVQIDPDYLKIITMYFNQHLDLLEAKVKAKFDGFLDENDKSHEKQYIRFPNLSFKGEEDFSNTIDRLIAGKMDYEEYKTEILDSMSLIDEIAIRINPCIRSDGYPFDSKTKIYVIFWHHSNLDTDKVKYFFMCCEMLARDIAPLIQELYQEAVKECSIGKTIYEEVSCEGKLITTIYYNDSVVDLYEHALALLYDEGLIEEKEANEVFLPLKEYGDLLFRNNLSFENNYDTFLQNTTVKEGVNISKQDGIFAITGDFCDNDDNEYTYIMAVAPYPRNSGIGLHLPIIKST